MANISFPLIFILCASLSIQINTENPTSNYCQLTWIKEKQECFKKAQDKWQDDKNNVTTKCCAIWDELDCARVKAQVLY